MTASGKPKDARRERLEQALRDNLKRRKAQARQRAQAAAERAADKEESSAEPKA